MINYEELKGLKFEAFCQWYEEAIQDSVNLPNELLFNLPWEEKNIEASLFHALVYLSRVRELDFLVNEKKQKITAVDAIGCTPLHYLSQLRYGGGSTITQGKVKQILSLLLEGGVDMNVLDKLANLALDYALGQEDSDLSWQLLALGSDISKVQQRKIDELTGGCLSLILQQQQDLCYKERFSLRTAHSLAFWSRLAYKGVGTGKEESFENPNGTVMMLARRFGYHAVHFVEINEIRALVADHETHQVIAFRGTKTKSNWVINLAANPTKDGEHAGFSEAIETIWAELRKHIDLDKPMFITGHSLGGALATLATRRLIEEVPEKAIETTMYTFGQPRVLTANAQKEFDQKIKQGYIIQRDGDTVPTVPPCGLGNYQHVGSLRGLGPKGFLHNDLHYAYHELGQRALHRSSDDVNDFYTVWIQGFRELQRYQKQTREDRREEEGLSFLSISPEVAWRHPMQGYLTDIKILASRVDMPLDGQTEGITSTESPIIAPVDCWQTEEKKQRYQHENDLAVLDWINKYTTSFPNDPCQVLAASPEEKSSALAWFAQEGLALILLQETCNKLSEEENESDISPNIAVQIKQPLSVSPIVSEMMRRFLTILVTQKEPLVALQQVYKALPSGGWSLQSLSEEEKEIKRLVPSNRGGSLFRESLRDLINQQNDISFSILSQQIQRWWFYDVCESSQEKMEQGIETFKQQALSLGMPRANWNPIYLKYGLNDAAQKGDIDAAQRYLRHGAIVNATTDTGKTALVYALESGKVDFAKWLITQGGCAKKIAKALIRNSALQVLLRSKSILGKAKKDLLYWLVLAGVDLSELQSNEVAHLTYAKEQDDTEDLVALLVKLMSAGRQSQLTKIVKAKFEKTDWINEIQREKPSLSLEKKRESAERASFFASKTDFEFVTDKIVSQQLLHQLNLIRQGKLDFEKISFNLLIDQLSDNSCLLQPILPYPSIFEWISEHGPETLLPEIIDSISRSCLEKFSPLNSTWKPNHLNLFLLKAAQDNDFKRLKRCVAAGADINISDENGNTALDFVIQANKQEEMNYLLDRGAYRIKDKTIPIALGHGFDQETMRRIRDISSCNTGVRKSVINLRQNKGNPHWIILDVDNTVVNSKGELNLPLIYALRAQKIETVYLMTAYSFSWNITSAAECNALRADIIRRLSRYGLNVRATIISASPYTEEKFGEYYFKERMPVERLFRNNLINGMSIQQADDAIAKEVKESEVTLIRENIIKEDQSTKGGKEHMLVHFLEQVPPKTKIAVFDDKIEVNQVVERLFTEHEIVREKSLILQACRATFGYTKEPVRLYEETLTQVTGGDEAAKKLMAKEIKQLVALTDDVLINWQERGTLEKQLQDLAAEVSVVVFTASADFNLPELITATIIKHDQGDIACVAFLERVAQEIGVIVNNDFEKNWSVVCLTANELLARALTLDYPEKGSTAVELVQDNFGLGACLQQALWTTECELWHWVSLSHNYLYENSRPEIKLLYELMCKQQAPDSNTYNLLKLCRIGLAQPELADLDTIDSLLALKKRRRKRDGVGFLNKGNKGKASQYEKLYKLTRTMLEGLKNDVEEARKAREKKSQAVGLETARWRNARVPT